MPTEDRTRGHSKKIYINFRWTKKNWLERDLNLRPPDWRAGALPTELTSDTKCNLPTRLKEHRAHGRRGDFEKSAIVKHSHIKDHQIDWQAAQLITPIDAWHPRHIREAIEIVKHDTVPQDIGFFISDIWRPILQTEGSSISKVHNPPQTEGSPISQVTLLPLCLLTTD